MKTTLNKIRERRPCSEGWKKLLSHLGKTKADDEPLSLVTILDSNGLDDAIWCLRTVEGYDREIRSFAVSCAKDVQHLMLDERSIKALDVAERYANGEATEEKLSAARAARNAALFAAAAYAARAAAWAADAAAWAAADAAYATAYATANAADAAADAARDAASAAAWDVAWADIRSKQEQRFREMVAKAEGQ